MRRLPLLPLRKFLKPMSRSEISLSNAGVLTEMQISQSLEKLTAMTWSAPSTDGDLTPLRGSVEPAMIIRFGSNLGKSKPFTKNGDTLS